MARPYRLARLCCGIWVRQTSRFLRTSLHGVRVRPRRALLFSGVVLSLLAVLTIGAREFGRGTSQSSELAGVHTGGVAVEAAYERSPGIRIAIPVDFSPTVQFPATPAPTASTAPPPDALTSDQEARSERVRQLMSGTPLAGYSVQMVLISDRYGIDWRLLPVIAVLESGGGNHACGGNAWGFAACRVLFGSLGEGIQVVASTLASPPYAGRPPSLVLCIWVAGTGCDNRQAVEYVQRAAPLYWRLGGALNVPALPAEAAPVTPEPVGLAAAETTAGSTATATPVPTQAGAPRTPTTTKRASPTAIRSPGTPTAEATKSASTAGAATVTPVATEEGTGGAG